MTNATATDSFVYVTFIRTTPTRLWQALTDPVFTRQYWQGIEFDTDWRTGSAMTMRRQPDLEIVDPEQVVLVAEPYRRLSYTWHTFTEDWARAYEVSDEFFARVAAEPRSTVTFDIEDFGGSVKLTVVHDGFEPGSAVLEGVSQGWPAILSSLKTLLETGDILPEPKAAEEVTSA